MESKQKSVFKDLSKIEEELKALWKLLSPSERHNRNLVQKMNHLQMTLHRLKFSQDMGVQHQAQKEHIRDTEIVSQQKVKRYYGIANY